MPSANCRAVIPRKHESYTIHWLTNSVYVSFDQHIVYKLLLHILSFHDLEWNTRKNM